ncbi:MAG: hypothetical protein ACR2M1_14435 [Gemmatimonadaceae bacterium]
MTEWAEEALDHPVLVRRGLREMAWDQSSIEAFVRRYAELQSSPLPRESRISRLRELLGMRRKEVEDVTTDWIHVPLYRFGAPAVTGAKVEYSEGESMVEGSGWSLKIFGIGAGDTTSLQVTKSKTFTATGGACKVVYVPVMLQVSKIAVFERDRLIGHGYQAQVASPSASGDPHLQRRGCSSLPRGECGGGPSDHYDVLDVALAGDTSGDLHRDRRSWETDVAREVSVSLSKIANVSALVRVKRTRRLELSFELPAGHNYRAYLCNGLTWWEHPQDARDNAEGRRRKSA